MTAASVSRLAEPHPEPEDVQEELRHVGDLVFLRDLLRERGADARELREYEAVIDEARARLAESAKRASARYAVTAA